MSKYRHDALESAPQFLPLASEEAVGALASSARFPVAVEVESSAASPANGPDRTTPVLWFRGAIPCTRIVRIHAPSALELEELLARAYRGFDWAQLRAEVSPRLFEAGSIVAAPPSAAPLPDGRLLWLREAVSGALVSAGSAELIDRFLRGLRDDAEVDALALLVQAAVSSGLIEEGDDRALLRASLDCILHQTQAGDIVPSELVQQIAARMASAGREGVDPYFRRILQLLRGEDELRPFQGRGSLLTPKALLLYVLRPDAEAVRRWADEDLNVESEVQILSQLLAGLGSRFEGLPAALRVRRGSEALLDWTADGLQHSDGKASDEWWRSHSTMSGESDGRNYSQEPHHQKLIEQVKAGDHARALLIAHELHWMDCLALEVVSSSFEASSTRAGIRVNFAPGADVGWTLIPQAFLTRLTVTDAEVLTSILGDDHTDGGSHGPTGARTIDG